MANYRDKMNINQPAAAPFVVLPGRRRSTIPREEAPVPHLPGLGWMGNTTRGHLVALIGEFVGTFLFLFFAFTGTQVANMSSIAANTTDVTPHPDVLLYIALAFGFSLAVNVWVFFRISGGLFNPAVTLGLCLVGAVGWLRGLVVFISQILGAIAASAVVSGLFPGPMLFRTSLSPITSKQRGVFIEMFLTAQLIFTIFMLAAEKHKGTFLAPIGIGLALFIAELAGVYWTGGSLNPARSFGPEVVAGHFHHDHWVYWVGPLLGALLSVLFYRLVKILEYETANPGADAERRASLAAPAANTNRGPMNNGANRPIVQVHPPTDRGYSPAPPNTAGAMANQADGAREDPTDLSISSDMGPDSSAFPHPPRSSMGDTTHTYLSNRPLSDRTSKHDPYALGSQAEKGHMSRKA